MTKTNTEQSFDFLVFKILWPNFKERGYKKSGNNFRYYDDSGWGKDVNLQKSIYKDRNHISFTINVGFYLSEAEQFHCNQQSQEKFLESICIVRRRIGELTKEENDLWFDLNEHVDTSTLYKTVKQSVTGNILPYVDSIQSREDIVQLLASDYKSAYRTAQIQTLYFNGQKERAKQLLEEEKSSSDNLYYLETIKEIENTFKD